MDIIERILNGDIDHISLEDLANALRTEGYLDLPSFHRMRSYTNCPHCGIGVSASDLSVRNIHLHAFVNTDLMTEKEKEVRSKMRYLTFTVESICPNCFHLIKLPNQKQSIINVL